MSLLAGRTAVVTGSAQGIGYAIAEAFAAEGANLVIADINGDAAEAAALQLGIGSRAIGVACDVSSGADVAALAQAATDRFGSLDVFVNNAGITRDATMRKMTEDMFDQVIAVHLRGSWLGTRAAAAVMREQPGGGSIVNISSISGKVGLMGQTNYSAAKAGMVGLTKAAAKEVGFANVRVNAVQPGLIRTPMTEGMREDIKEARLKEIALGRMGEATEIAQAVLFLASDMSSYITGAVVEVTGGRHM
ncbi:3-oxoacyl-[acyl-carrier protein] reductase [Leucobacter exalbidus]|uniref:3-oxoacyl-[acyl-carrier protein] reductase n=1 Tax=Leucobacter exalbidus TaxID=662960 RepID=A0A940Q056_9MICO|nr:3-oxoacyl-ACP reductase FabG [Leucobacter exalbidus]MBP1327296.1 3-oxoacyl-[acyl-carrier protein] reductase [Leucobacter exalbidus]